MAPKLYRSYDENALPPDPVTNVERIYRHYIDICNYEAVEGHDLSDGDKLLVWKAAGVGSWFRPVGTIVGREIVVRGVPYTTVTLTNREHCDFVKGGAGLPIRFEEE